AASHARLTASVYPGGGQFGVWARGTAERFALTVRAPDLMPTASEASAIDVAAALAWRPRASGALGGQLLLGYGYQSWPAFATGGVEGDGVALSQAHHRFAVGLVATRGAGRDDRPLAAAPPPPLVAPAPPPPEAPPPAPAPPPSGAVAGVLWSRGRGSAE